MHRRFGTAWAVLILVVLTACGPLPSPAPTGQPQPQHAPTPTPTPAPTAASPCPPPNPDLQPTPPAAPLAFPDGYLALIGNYLSAGGTAVEALLLQEELLPPRGQAAVRADLTGDGWPETAVAFIDPQSEVFPPVAALAVYACAEGSVQSLTQRVEEPGFTLALVGASDLTEDGVDELVFFEETCGAHTCWDSPVVWHWDGSAFVDLMPPMVEYPYAEITLEGAQMIVTAYGIASVGAGIQRTITETWQWTGETMTITGHSESPPTTLFHLFNDGDRALQQDDYDDAFAAYRRLLDEGTELATASLSFSDTEERAWFEALAHWRLLTLDLLLGNTPAANREYTWLNALEPQAPAAPVAQAARRFWEAYRQSGNVAYACLEVDNSPEIVTPILTFLNSFGYANPPYDATMVCPFLTPSEAIGGTP